MRVATIAALLVLAPLAARAQTAAGADGKYFVGTWHCGTVQWTFAPLVANSNWVRVTYGDPRQPGGVAVMGFVPELKRWIYRDFHADGSYADLTAPAPSDGKWVWSGPYYPSDGGLLNGRVTYTVVDDNEYDRTFESLEGSTYTKRGGDKCIKRLAPHTLESNGWTAVEIGGRPVTAAAPPSLRFDAKENRVSGTTGCNDLAGGYQQGGGNLTFTAIATTRRACAPPLDALETGFLKALAQTAAFSLGSDTLTLMGSGGERLMVLRATR